MSRQDYIKYLLDNFGYSEIDLEEIPTETLKEMVEYDYRFKNKNKNRY
jgi:hypothetical protein